MKSTREQLFLQAPNALLFIDPINNQLLNINKKAELMFGLNPNRLDGYQVSQLFSSNLDKLLGFTQQVLDQGSAWTNELTLTVESSRIDIEVNAVKIGECIMFSCENTAVVFERHYQAIAQENYQSGLFHWQKNETIFEEIERQNQLLLTAVGDGIYGVDAQGNTTFVNHAAEQMIGWSKAELVGKNMHDVIHYSHTDGQNYPAHACPIYAAFNDGEIHSVDDEVFWSKSGEAIPVEYTSTPLTDKGQIIGAVVIFRDISERNKTQNALLDALAEVDQLKKRLERENAYLLEEINADFNQHQIIGKSEAVKQMIHQIDLVAPSEANVFITGESGTGKELIARAIHEASERKARSLIRVNCAAIPAELFESEFFGHVKGAFSGAIKDRVGRFELADGATIFLDEVGEIPLSLQGKLLRVLQEQQFERVGESVTRKVNVRVISATNQNLKQLILENKFREDLYFRLNVFPVHSPALRDRIEDIPLLAHHFISKISQRINLPKPQISIAQMQHLERYLWPGNIRELENIIERQIILAKGNKISFEFIAQEQHEKLIKVPDSITDKVFSAQQQKALERDNLINALAQCKGKVYGENGAAQLLGLKPTTFSSKLKKYGIIRQAYC